MQQDAMQLYHSDMIVTAAVFHLGWNSCCPSMMGSSDLFPISQELPSGGVCLALLLFFNDTVLGFLAMKMLFCCYYYWKQDAIYLCNDPMQTNRCSLILYSLWLVNDTPCPVLVHLRSPPAPSSNLCISRNLWRVYGFTSNLRKKGSFHVSCKLKWCICIFGMKNHV